VSVTRLIAHHGLRTAPERLDADDRRDFSFAFSAGIGVVFAFVPARRAAQLNPIEVLRHE